MTSVSAATDDCEQAGPLKLRPALEPLLLQHAVTAVVAGHVHNYERTTPVTNGSVAAEDSAPVHVTVGNAGDIEGMTRGWARVRPAWSAARSLALGWSRWSATATALTLELLATADDFGKVKLFRYPCIVPRADHRLYGGHSSHVTNIGFTANDAWLVSTGGDDRAVFQWEVVHERQNVHIS